MPARALRPAGLCLATALLVCLVAARDDEDKGFDHSSWGKVLKAHVSDGWVDYAALKKNTGDLRLYLARLARADLGKLDRNEKIALYVNAYNAFTAKLITEYYPDIKSIKDIPDGIFGPKRWKHKRWKVAGEVLSLSQIEHEILRAKFKDPRVHYALNCASIGCPPLRPEPYTGGELDEQFDSAARDFNASARGMRLDKARRRVYLSQIYKWYEEDFEEAAGSVLRYVAAYADDDTARYIRVNEGRLDIKYLDYDWRLNDVNGKPP